MQDKTGCAVAIGGDRYLGFIHHNRDDGHIVLGTYRYHCSDHTWHDFQLIYEWPKKEKCYVYPMSLGDGVVSAVVWSHYVLWYYDRDDGLPITHYISIGLFGDNGPNFKRLDFRQYKDGNNMRQCQRRITTAFPFLFSFSKTAALIRLANHVWHKSKACFQEWY
ncbi:hypothetical protein HS088_TW07G00953 [Tripterygium wilfordii]|uniref:Uncharacterized protein n=1 Tax=Tripterygium wilfordii TaxID=458696 RepID=A0A7J7DGG6_TRIWF|nr:hypothetical protein HS088_TW07G00953 [Tripterygium wilfordii]